ncbi:hypothetical protein [Dipodfec virus UOA04_Rod_1017]|nr:hypothetical protein [Dipodfec virus UOA04_Rod_1017]
MEDVAVVALAASLVVGNLVAVESACKIFLSYGKRL